MVIVNLDIGKREILREDLGVTQGGIEYLGGLQPFEYNQVIRSPYPFPVNYFSRWNLEKGYSWFWSTAKGTICTAGAKIGNWSKIP